MTEVNTGMSELNKFHKKDDPLNVRITKLIKEHVFSGSVGQAMMQESHELQLDYYRDCLAHLTDSDYIHQRNQEVLKALADTTNSRIVSGKDYISLLSKGKPALIVLNHFSIYKLTGIKQEDLGVQSNDIDDVSPPPIHFSSVYPIAEILGANLYDAHLELPEPLLTIQKAGGFVGVPSEKDKQFGTVLDRTRELITKHPNSLTVVFPEGGTSGRTNNGGPFDMLDFRSGAFSIAAQLEMPVLPAVQYFNPDSGFEIAIFKPIKPNPNLSKEDALVLARSTQEEMQEWLDAKKK